TLRRSPPPEDDPPRGGASGVILRESPTTADPSGPCRERREPRWRSPALPVAGASLIDRCQQQHRGAIWPGGACRRLGVPAQQRFLARASPPRSVMLTPAR